MSALFNLPSRMGSFAAKNAKTAIVVFAFSLFLFILGVAGSIVFVDKTETTGKKSATGQLVEKNGGDLWEYRGMISPIDGVSSALISHSLTDSTGKVIAYIKSNDDSLSFLQGREVTIRGTLIQEEEGIPWINVEGIVFK